jgi:hypothetical protein
LQTKYTHYIFIAGTNDYRKHSETVSFYTYKEIDNTSIHNKKSKDDKYGIFLEKAIASDVAKIEVKTPEQSQINIKISDNIGNVVFETNGRNTETFIWDLTNKANRFVGNGAYLVLVEAKGQSEKVYGYSARVGVRR